MATSKSALEHSMVLRQWTWPFRMAFWWLVIALSVWAFTMATQWIWAMRLAPADPVTHVQQVLDSDVEAMTRLAPGFFKPKTVALWIGGTLRDSAVMTAVGFARALVNWPIAFRKQVAAANPNHPLAATLAVDGTSADPGGDQMLVELGGRDGAWPVLLAATYVFAVRTAVYLCALPLLILAAAVGVVDGLVARAKRRASAGGESGSLYHRAKLGLSFVGITGYIVCLGLPSLSNPTPILVGVALSMGLLVRLQTAFYKKYL
jgi:hypothetical protein